MGKVTFEFPPREGEKAGTGDKRHLKAESFEHGTVSSESNKGASADKWIGEIPHTFGY